MDEESRNGRLEHASRWSTASIVVLAVVAGLAAGCGSSNNESSATTGTTPAASSSASSLAPIHGTYSPTIEPANFVTTIDNRYFPLEPGTGFHYQGVRGKTPQTDDMVVTRQSKMILGVRATVVRDTVAEHGAPVERTFDWYAQDKEGNVWYMGEDSLELSHGRFVRASDSWQSGVNGARPGIIMPGNPEPGDAYRQEYYPPGQALDEARVLGRQGNVRVPYGTFGHALVTLERSPLEPQTEKKIYVRGVGEVAEYVV